LSLNQKNKNISVSYRNISLNLVPWVYGEKILHWFKKRASSDMAQIHFLNQLRQKPFDAHKWLIVFKPHKHAYMCQYWADAAGIRPVLATNGMFTGKLTFIV